MKTKIEYKVIGYFPNSKTKYSEASFKEEELQRAKICFKARQNLQKEHPHELLKITTITEKIDENNL